MNGILKGMQELKPAFLMVLVQGAYAITIMLYKLAINDGMSVRVITAYRNIFGAVFSFSLALIFERKNRPKLTLRVLWMSFFSGRFGASLFQNLAFTSLALVSATFQNARLNVVPAITFILSVICGYEKLSMQTVPGKAKVLGKILGISGSMLLSFLKGVEINIWKNIDSQGTSHGGSKREWLGVLSGICWAFISCEVVIGAVLIVCGLNVMTTAALATSIVNRIL